MLTSLRLTVTPKSIPAEGRLTSLSSLYVLYSSEIDVRVLSHYVYNRNLYMNFSYTNIKPPLKAPERTGGRERSREVS